jgi:hypothetical protein
MATSASLPIGKYMLDMGIGGLTGLTEFSSAEYAIYGRQFDAEKNYNAPGAYFLDRPWKVALGTVRGKVYKIALYFESENLQSALHVATDVMQFCRKQLGQPSKQQGLVSMWDAPDGNVVLQLAKVGSVYVVNVFETSESVRSFVPVSNSHTAEWRAVPIEIAYWHPVNKGFSRGNAKFMCSECGSQYLLPVCPDCGCESSQLGTSMGLPGVFCERCGKGGISWTCPNCSTAHKAMLVFYYDITAVKVRKRRFWE